MLKNIYVLCPNFQKPGKKQRQINVFYVILHFSREVSHFLCPEPVFSNGVSRRGHAPPRKCGVCRRPLLPGPMAGGIGTISLWRNLGLLISPPEKSLLNDFSRGEIASSHEFHPHFSHCTRDSPTRVICPSGLSSTILYG